MKMYTTHLAAVLNLIENGVIFIANGMVQVPRTLTIRKFLNFTLYPNFCIHRAIRLAANLA